MRRLSGILMSITVALFVLGIAQSSRIRWLLADEMTAQEYADLMTIYQNNFLTPIDSQLMNSFGDLGESTGGIYNDLYGDLTPEEYADLMLYCTLFDPLPQGGN